MPTPLKELTTALSILIPFFKENEIINYFVCNDLNELWIQIIRDFYYLFFNWLLLNTLFICCCWTIFVVFWTNFYFYYLSFYFLFKGVKDYVGAKYLFFQFFIKILWLLPLLCSLCCTLANTWRRWTINTLLFSKFFPQLHQFPLILSYYTPSPL